MENLLWRLLTGEAERRRQFENIVDHNVFSGFNHSLKQRMYLHVHSTLGCVTDY